MFKEHLRFLANNRTLLRLKLNATEDLLVNGARDPTHRGVCLHLLRKVDRACINAALVRLSDAGAKAKLLAGIVRFSSDITTVLQYLESVSELSDRDDAAAALAVGLERVDFAVASPAQMRRVLDLIVALFEARQRPPLMFRLLQSASFRRAFDDSLDALPTELSEIVVPLRAVYAAVIKGGENPFGEEELGRGISLLLDASEGALRSHSEPVRRRLFEYGIDPRSSIGTPRALRILLDSFEKTSRTHSVLAMQWVRNLLAGHRDADARLLLQEVAHNHRGFRQPARWLEALDQPRMGRIVLDGADEQKEAIEPDQLQRGLWLDEQRSVLVRVADEAQAQRYAREAELHRALALPSVVPLLVSDCADDGSPHIAVAAVGRPANLQKRGPHPETLLRVAFDGVMLLRALADRGIRLPDANPGRFVVDGGGRYWLASLAGAESVESSTAAKAHLALAIEWCRTLLALSREPPAALHRVLGGEADWEALSDALAATL